MPNTTKLAEAQKNGIYTPEFWQKRLLGLIAIDKAEFVFQNLGVEVTIPKNQGTKVFSVRRYNRLPVNITNQLLTEGVAPDAFKIEGQKVSGTVSQYGAMIRVTDVTEDLHMDNIKSIYQPELSRHALETRERIILASFSEASEYYVSNRTAKSSLIATDVLTFKDLRRVALQMRINLRNGHSSTGGAPLAIVSPQVMADLLDDDALTNKMLATGMENNPIKVGSLKSYQAWGLFVRESLICETVPTSGTKQVNTATIVAASGATTAGNAKVTVTGAGIYGSPRVLSVPLTTSMNTATLVAGAIASAIGADANIVNAYAVTTSGATVILTANTALANDTTLNIATANDTCVGLTSAPTSVATTAGVAGFNAYTSYLLGFEPYAVLSLGNLTWHDVPFTATVGNELAQTASVGYKMWAGAKVIDPMAITRLYSRSGYDVYANTADAFNRPASQL